MECELLTQLRRSSIGELGSECARPCMSDRHRGRSGCGVKGRWYTSLSHDSRLLLMVTLQPGDCGVAI